MSELSIRSGEHRLTLAESERLGFGRVNVEPGGSKGWGYDGRFLELGPQTYIHRIWGELVWKQGLWHVRSLATRHPVIVVPADFRPIELPPMRAGGSPHEFAVTQQDFAIILSVAADSFRIDCSSTAEAELASDELSPMAGSVTMALCDELAAGITATEFRVLWVMSREYRSPATSADASPLSYSRICRALDLSDKQAISAVERIMKRMRAAGVVPPGLPATQQRDWMCRQVVAHGVLDALGDRHGTPSAD
ncbi:hypothetical protein BH10ACT3_BH10ACT3_07940 [soil metagenome]